MKINAFPMWYEIWKGRKKSSAKGWFEPRSIASKRPRHAPYHLRHWNWWFVAIFYNIDYPTEKVKVTWHTAKYGNPYSELVLCIYPSKVHTHSSEHTHTWTHTRSSGQPFMLRRQGSSWGSVPCSRAPQSWYWGWRERWLFTPLTYNPAGPETRTRNLWITSPTL